MIELLVAGMISAGTLAALVALIGVLLAGQLVRLGDVLRADGVSRAGPDQLRLPLRFAA